MPQAAAGGNTTADQAGVASAASGAGAATPPDTNFDFADLVLEDLGIEPDTTDADNIVEWMEHENSPSTWTGTAGANNPLNNGLGSGGGSGLGSYPDLTTAAGEVAAELSGAKGSGLTGGAAVIKDLQTSAPEAQFATDIENTNWAGGHYGHAAWSASAVPTVTAESSASSGATGPVKVGPGTVALSTGAGSAPGPNDPNGGSGAAAKPPIGGSGNILQELDGWLNPSGGSTIDQWASLGTSDIAAAIEQLVARGIFVMIFAGIAYLGVKTFLSKSSGSFDVPSPSDYLENRQRQSAVDSRNDLAQQRIDATRAETARRAGPQPVQRREIVKTTNATVTHKTTKPPKGGGAVGAGAGAGALEGAAEDAIVML
jgi:hypothetical protein